MFWGSVFFANPEKSFVILMCGYNNKLWVVSSLDSVRVQNYSNYRIIYIDDASADDTYETVVTYAKKHNMNDRITIIRNEVRRRKLANWYDAIHDLIEDDEIVVLLDADDRLAHVDVLNILNRVYTETDCWFAYSQYRNDPSFLAKQWGISELGSSAPISEEISNTLNYRDSIFIFMHLRTFYAWLFKQIRIADLISRTVEHYINNFFPASNDLAIMFPMVEMATKHIQFIPQVLYIRNLYPDNIGFKVDSSLQARGSVEIRSKRSYDALFKPVRSIYTWPKIDVLILAKSPDNLLQELVFYKENSPQLIRTISVIVPSWNSQQRAWWNCLQRSIRVPCYCYEKEDDLAFLIQDYIRLHRPEYLYITTQHGLLPDTIVDDIALLKKTKADGLLYCVCPGEAQVVVDGHFVYPYEKSYECATQTILLSLPVNIGFICYEDQIKMRFSQETTWLVPLSNYGAN